MQIVDNLISWLGQRCKGLGINEYGIPHRLSSIMNSNAKAFFTPQSSFYGYPSVPSLFHVNFSSSWQSSESHHPFDKIPFPTTWIHWLESNKWFEFFMQLLEELMLHGHTIRCLHLFHSRSSSHPHVSCKQTRVQFMGANNPFSTLTSSQWTSSSMVTSPSMLIMSTSSTQHWLQSSSSDTSSSNCKYAGIWISNHHGESHNRSHNIQWYYPM